MNRFSILLAGCLLSSISVTANADLGTRIAGDPKGWEVMQKKDAMTDKPVCVAIYMGKPYIQVDDNSFFISAQGKGGVEAYQYRVNDLPPTSLISPTETEKKISAFNLGPAEVAHIFSGETKRIRVRVMTLLNSSFDEDINTTGLVPLKDVLSGSQCH